MYYTAWLPSIPKTWTVNLWFFLFESWGKFKWSCNQVAKKFAPQYPSELRQNIGVYPRFLSAPAPALSPVHVLHVSSLATPQADDICRYILLQTIRLSTGSFAVIVMHLYWKLHFSSVCWIFDSCWQGGWSRIRNRKWFSASILRAIKLEPMLWNLVKLWKVEDTRARANSKWPNFPSYH